ncbi:GNAT family N-acetyltransferase [Mesorhizobium sp. 1M-11]|uniref:GNAT family N-acetyltransferase n=1 Tax=Mesorhizobium sp. 1M-11 TaxID=1529006 RepID=UPI000AD330FA|nr:GNAT family N-acetyltransferase [Mesorhizobium sp. 1M-11]
MPGTLTEIGVRDAVPSDLDFLRESLSTLNDEMTTLIRSNGRYREGSPGLNIEACLQSEAFLIAAKGDERRGFLSIYHPGSTKGALLPLRQQATIDTLFVLPQFRRKGLASMLLEAAETKCRGWGAAGIGLSFLEGNHAAAAAYQKAGYMTIRHAMWRSLD